MNFTKGQRVIYIKSGQSPTYNTEWPATYVRETATKRHTIRVDGQKNLKTVSIFSLCLPANQEGQSK